MGPLFQVEIPEKLQDELHGETPLFAVRESHAISNAGANGAYVVAVFMAIGAAIMLFLGGQANATVEVGGVSAPADSDQGMFLSRLAGISLGLAALAFFVVTPILRRRPGSVVVGTPTRILRTWMFGVAAMPWRDFRDARLEPDGSIVLVRFVRGRGLHTPDDIVQPPNAIELLGVIRELIRAPIEAAAASRSKLDDFAFESTHRAGLEPGFRGVMFALGMLFFGGILIVFFGVGLLIDDGATTTISTNGGPPREVGRGDFVAWVPSIVGLVMATIGALVFFAMRSPAKPIKYLATSEALHVFPKEGSRKVIPWTDFEGEFVRIERRGRVELRFPLRTERVVRTSRGRYTEHETLRIVGVKEPDEVQAAFTARLAHH